MKKKTYIFSIGLRLWTCHPCQNKFTRTVCIFSLTCLEWQCIESTSGTARNGDISHCIDCNKWHVCNCLQVAIFVLVHCRYWVRLISYCPATLLSLYRARIVLSAVSVMVCQHQDLLHASFLYICPHLLFIFPWCLLPHLYHQHCDNSVMFHLPSFKHDVQPSLLPIPCLFPFILGLFLIRPVQQMNP